MTAHPTAGHRGSARGQGLPARAPGGLRDRGGEVRMAAAAHASTGVWNGSTSSPRSARIKPALTIVEEDGTSRSWTYEELSRRSDQVAGWLQANGVERGRPDRADARQPGRAVGDHPRRDQARRGDHPGQHPADPGGPGRPGAARRRQVRGRPGRRCATSFRHVPGTFLRIAVGRPVEGWIEYDDSVNYPADGLRPGRRQPGRATRCCCTSPPAPRRCPNWLSTARSRIRSGICRRCTGSACSPATCT